MGPVSATQVDPFSKTEEKKGSRRERQRQRKTERQRNRGRGGKK